MKILSLKVMVLLLGLSLCVGIQSQEHQTASFEEKVGGLLTNSNKQKTAVIEELAEIDDPRVITAFRALIDTERNLYSLKENKQIIIVNLTGGEGSATDLLTGELLGTVTKKQVRKVRTNNKLRRFVRSKLAILELSSSDSDVRYQSAKNLLKKPNPEMRDLLVSRMKDEESNKVAEILELVIAIIDVNAEDQEKRMIAVTILSQSVEPEAINEITKLVQKDEAGNYLEANTELAEFAERRLKVIDSKLSFFKFIENLLYGLSLGSILLLAAIGLAITFGVMGVINMAHGEMIMLGAYTTFAIQQLFPELISASLLIAIPAAFLVSGAAGVLIERLVIRHLYGRPLDTLLATFGISLILQQAVRMYSSNNVAVKSPEWISGFWQINGAMSLTYNRIYIIFFSVLVLFLLAMLLKKTMMGLQMRAVTQNRAMANSMGIRSGWVDALTFGLGSGIAGIAGVALSQITNVGPNMGQGYIIDSFMVVVFGGVGNLLGTFFGALSLGVANKFLEPYAGAVVGKIIVLVFIILFIQWRPRGLFALKGRFVED